MAERIIRGRVIGFRKVKQDDASDAAAEGLTLEIAVEPLSDRTLWALVAAQPEVDISINDVREQDQ